MAGVRTGRWQVRPALRWWSRARATTRISCWVASRSCSTGSACASAGVRASTSAAFTCRSGPPAPRNVVSQPGPKRVALRFLRDVEGELFVNSLHVGLKANHTEAELARWQRQVETLTTTIKTIALARRGGSGLLRLHAAGRHAGQRQRRHPRAVDSRRRLLRGSAARLAGRDAGRRGAEEGHARRLTPSVRVQAEAPQQETQMTRWLTSIVLAAGLLAVGQAQAQQAVEVEGQKFEPTVAVGGQNLSLNGVGLRKRAIFRSTSPASTRGRRARTRPRSSMTRARAVFRCGCCAMSRPRASSTRSTRG